MSLALQYTIHINNKKENENTPVSSPISLLAASSTVSSISHPPFGNPQLSVCFLDEIIRIWLSLYGTPLNMFKVS